MAISPEFRAAVKSALARARAIDDDALARMAGAPPRLIEDSTLRAAAAYMADGVPVYADYQASADQAAAAGCASCSYIGLWAFQWPGYQASKHGLVFVFEKPLQQIAAQQGGDLETHTFNVLIHEFGHALQRDHVLEAMEEAGAGGVAHPRGCNCPGSRPII